MTLEEFKKKVLGLIEEVSPTNENLTEDPDIATKIHDVINQVMFEMARMKKLPKYVEIAVTEGDIVTFEQIETESGYEVYQLANVGGVKCEFKAQGTVIKVKDSGTMEVEFYAYPERITEKTKISSYEFELSNDVLEIMPYGVAGDLLKSDKSTEYGSVYAERYEAMKRELDPRYNMGSIYFDGGVTI
jgi:hypothetical protein